MNVCSRAYWPVRQAWLVVSVKQIQLELGREFPLILGALALKLGVFLHEVMEPAA